MNEPTLPSGSIEIRRNLLIALGATAFGFPLSTFAQQGKVWRIGFLGTASAAGYVKETDAIRAGLRDLGYVENKNIVFEFRWAENDAERLKAMAAELVGLKVDVIITHGSVGIRAARSLQVSFRKWWQLPNR